MPEIVKPDRTWRSVKKKSLTPRSSGSNFMSYGGAQGYSHFGGGLFNGGIKNSQTGMGTDLDSSEYTTWLPTRFLARQLLETVYVESWAARKFIDVPIDDMTIRWREIDMTEDVNEDEIDLFKKAESKFKVRQKLVQAMKSASLFGSSLLVMIVKNQELDTEFDVENLAVDSLVNLVVLDRYDCTVAEYDANLLSETYGLPLMYTLTPRHGGKSWVCHSSRVIRFDGIAPISDAAFTLYDQWWGISKLIPIMLSIAQDQSIATSIAQMSKEASIPVIKMAGIQDAIAGQVDENEFSMEEIGQRLNQLKSVFRIMFLADSDEFQRVGVDFQGLHELIDRFAIRIAAAADIPATRFWGRSPVGLNATGDSDMTNYAIRVNALQELSLREPLKELDKLLIRHAGIQRDDPFSYRFPTLIDISDKEQAETDEIRANTLTTLLDRQVIDENEVRERLSNIEFFGTLEEIDLDDLAEQRMKDAEQMFGNEDDEDDDDQDEDDE